MNLKNRRFLPDCTPLCLAMYMDVHKEGTGHLYPFLGEERGKKLQRHLTNFLLEQYYRHFRVFGCTSFVRIPAQLRDKLLAHLVERGEALGTPISFFGAVSFPVPPPRHSASLPVLRKNQALPSSLIWGEREPSTSWEARHQVSGLMRITKLTRRSWLLAQQGGALPHRRRTRGSVRGGASGFQFLSLAHLQVKDSLPTLSLTKKALNQLISSVGDEMLLKSPNSYSCYEGSKKRASNSLTSVEGPYYIRARDASDSGDSMNSLHSTLFYPGSSTEARGSFQSQAVFKSHCSLEEPVSELHEIDSRAHSSESFLLRYRAPAITGNTSSIPKPKVKEKSLLE
ncbi:hypothetical protein QVD17_30369 [Tagetes erecta]|uniref:Uncharacterized protein n=1 Tax=Tagetes erecta TaxID=13708 RepID=A0AAD8K1E5_TARER|nr:hypothetical protein QVD17_30369 [Tagetes erecta]